MLTTLVLTDQQTSNFHRDGYGVVRGVFGAAEMQKIEAWTRELAALPEEPGRH